jgi:hypothetical protein
MARMTLLCALLAILAFSTAAAEPVFRDATAASGLRFTHSNGATGDKPYQEVMGSGVCVLDYDGDGLLDIYFVSSVGQSRLFRNLGDLHFRDVTAEAGVGDAGYGMGATAADIDNDGDADLFVTAWGPNRLFVNRGDGTFAEEAAVRGLDDPRWGAGATFFDADLNGLPDLYLANYVAVADPDTNECYGVHGVLRIYCLPGLYPRQTDVFYRNAGEGRFVDATESAGFSGVAGRGLGCLAADLDDDGLVDVYVANDMDPNFFFRNLGGGAFEESGMFSGTAYSEEGMEQAGMGVAAADYDADGRMDLVVTNFQNEPNTLYRDDGGGFFLERSAVAGIGSPSLPRMGWGIGFLDFDLDGRLDLFVSNGHVEPDIAEVDQAATWKQPDLLFHAQPDGTFREVAAEYAPVLETPRAGRGVAFADLDNDGDTDILLNSQNGPAVLLENTGPGSLRWIGFRITGRESGRDGLGARVTLHAGGAVRIADVQAGGSYLSGNDPRVLFGLGDAQPDSVVVRWPGGRRQASVRPEAGRYHEIMEGGE